MRVKFQSRDHLLEELFDLRQALSTLRRNTITRNSNSYLFNELTEFYNFALYYSALALYGKIDYPFSIVKQQRPDCKVFEGDTVKGLEITRATAESYQKWLKDVELKGVPLSSRIEHHTDDPVTQVSDFVMVAIEKKVALLPAYYGCNRDMMEIDLLISAEHPSYMHHFSDIDVIAEGVSKKYHDKINGSGGYETISVMAGVEYLIYGINHKTPEVLTIPGQADAQLDQISLPL